MTRTEILRAALLEELAAWQSFLDNKPGVESITVRVNLARSGFPRSVVFAPEIRREVTIPLDAAARVG
jgi:hypothetical protein